MARLQYQSATNPRGFQPIQLSRAGIARMEEEGNRVIRNLEKQRDATNQQRRDDLQAMQANSAYAQQARERNQRTLEQNIKTEQLSIQAEQKSKQQQADANAKAIESTLSGLVDFSVTLGKQAGERTKKMIEDQTAEGAMQAEESYYNNPQEQINYKTTESQLPIESAKYDYGVSVDSAKGLLSSAETAKSIAANPARSFYAQQGYDNKMLVLLTSDTLARELKDTTPKYVDERTGKKFSGFEANTNRDYMRQVLGEVSTNLRGSNGLNLNLRPPGYLESSSDTISKLNEAYLRSAERGETKFIYDNFVQEGRNLRSLGVKYFQEAFRLDSMNPEVGRTGAWQNVWAAFSALDANGAFLYDIDDLNNLVLTDSGKTVLEERGNSQGYQNALAARRKAKTDFLNDDQARVRTEVQEFDRQIYAGLETLLNAEGTGPGRDEQTIATFIAGRNKLFPGEPLSQRIVNLQKSNLLENQAIEMADLQEKIRLRSLDPAAIEKYTNPTIQGQAAIAYKELKKESLGPDYARTEKIIKEKALFVTQLNTNVVGKENYQTFIFEKAAKNEYEYAYKAAREAGASPETAQVEALAYVDKVINSGIEDPNSIFYRTTGPLNSLIFPKLEAKYSDLAALEKESYNELLKGILKKGVKIVDEPGALGTVGELEESNNDYYSNNGKFRYNSKEQLVAKVLDVPLYAVRNARTQAFNKADGGNRRLIEPTPLEKEVFDQDPQTLKLITDTDNITNNRFRRTVHSTNSMGNGPVRASMTPLSTNPPSSGGLSMSQARQYALEAGFTPEDARVVAAIARGESGLDPTNSTRRSGLEASTGEDSVGLMQINWGYHKNSGWLQKLGINSREDLFDPVLNMKAAKYLYDNRGSFDDWTVYTKGIYKQYLNTVNTPLDTTVNTPLNTYAPQVSSITYDTGQPGIDVFFEDHNFPAVLPGRVKDIGYQVNANGSGYGHYLVIESIDPATGEPVDVLYGHLPTAPTQSRGQSIGLGEIIGQQGGTGSVQSYDGTIASIDFLAPAAPGSKSMTPYRHYNSLRRTIASKLK
jgi:hypothetical protein